MWKEGGIKVNESMFHYWMKYYDECSFWGIEQGKISKLTLKRGQEITANYDRGWDIAPIDDDTKAAVAILLENYNH